MSNLETIDIYADESKAQIYIKTFMHINCRKPSENKAKDGESSNYNCNFLSIDCETEMVWRGQ